jgi:hypothetical protein
MIFAAGIFIWLTLAAIHALAAICQFAGPLFSHSPVKSTVRSAIVCSR